MIHQRQVVHSSCAAEIGSLAIPGHGFRAVLWQPKRTVGILVAKVVHGPRIARIRCLTEPAERLGFILGNAASVLVGLRERQRPKRNVGIGTLAEEAHRFRFVLGHAISAFVHEAKIHAGYGVAVLVEGFQDGLGQFRVVGVDLRAGELE